MAKLNFKKFPCYTDIRKENKREYDLQYDLANQMYLNGSGIAMGALAMKIYNADGEQDYNEQECRIIIDFAKTLNPIIHDSIKDMIEAQNANK